MTTHFKFRNRDYSVISNGDLTEKEEVEAAAIMLGLTYKESAKLRGVSPETAKCQRASAKSKVEARSQAEFVMEVINRGWLFSFLRGLLGRAAQKARKFFNAQAQSLRCVASKECGPMFPLFCHTPHTPLSYSQLGDDQRAHLKKLSADNAVRYLAYLSARQLTA